MQYKTEKERSSGGVIFKKENGQYKVILISRKNGTVWCLPKGKVEKNEKIEQTALREVKEETGLEGEIRHYLNDVHYWYIDKKRGLRLNKTVHFFLLEYKSGNIDMHDDEADAVEWFDLDTAIEKDTYETEQKTLKEAKLFLTNK